MNHNLARNLRNRLTPAEERLWRRLRCRQLDGCKFRRQAPVGNYIVDFICFERKLIIELDGGHHAEQQQADRTRQAWLESQGFRVLRFWNHDVLESTDAVLEVVWRALTTAGE
jgi:very-short-patch-repair endonuclease